VQCKRRLTLFVAAFTLVSGFLTSGALAASKEAVVLRVLHYFRLGKKGGTSPAAGLIFDAAGNLYGTTVGGGVYETGIAFKLSPGANGMWSETVLHTFGEGNDGYKPYAGLISDAAGNLYGTTSFGGSHCGSTGCGIVFQLTPVAGGSWSESVLYSFNDTNNDGNAPYAGLIFDAVGNLYGTTAGGGVYNDGTVFELSPGGNGTWNETVLYSFGKDKDGNTSYASLIFDAVGNLYGTTAGGGADDNGTVFELSPGANGMWTETVLHSFRKGDDGNTPYAGLVLDAAGNLYGTTVNGGRFPHSCINGKGCGTVFEVAAGTNGVWKETVLHRFDANNGDGSNPYGGLIFDATGNLYGTTISGGVHHKKKCSGFSRQSLGCGTVFELTRGANGKWNENVLKTFGGGINGSDPAASLIFDAAGNLYGTTTYLGRGAGGTVFEVAP